ncbi:MAG: endonuclease/exonuclease/phosphatase family protein [Acidobacteriota bacterium]
MKLKRFFVGGLFATILSASAIFAQTVTPINQIQGEVFKSAFEGKPVTTRGIVTAIVRRGFYIQTPDAEIDANPKTSEGIYVFTNQEAPNVSLGNLVEVSGTVTEYVPRAERYFLPLTEIVRPTTKVISKDNPLPNPISLTTAEINPQSKLDQMERFEGMRVKVEQLIVVAPTGGRVNEKTGEATTDGVFFGVVAGTPRPFREAGLDALTIIMDKLPNTIPMFDMNPELLRIDSDSQTGAKPIDVTAGATLKNLTGVVDYSFKSYTILVDANNPPVIEGNKTFIATSPAGEREVTVGAFNIENFFDDGVNSKDVNKETIYPTDVFQKRLNKASLAIRKGLSSPDVLGIIEVENLIVLKKLADKINADTVADGKPNPNYQAYLEESNDIRGIDVGFLVKTSKVKVVEAKAIGKDEKLVWAGANEKEMLHDRPPFLLSAEVTDAKTNQTFAFTTIVNHFKSYRGIDDPKDGDRVRNKRRLQAEWLAKSIEERTKANPTERLIAVGDFNAFPFNDGFNDLIGILKGKSEQNVVTPSKTAFQTGLVNLADYIDAKNRYSYVFGGSAQILDHILVNKPARERAVKFGYARLNADFPAVYRGDINRPERLSDHDAPVFYMSLDEKKPAEATKPN